MSAPDTEARAGGGEGDFVLTAAAIADLVGGRLIGNPSAEVSGIAPLDRAGARELSFLSNARYSELFTRSRAGVVLVAPELEEAEARDVASRIVVPRPHEALLGLIPRFHRPTVPDPGIHATATLGRGARIGAGSSIAAAAVIGSGARLGERVVIGPGCVVGDGVEIGDDTRLFPNVTLYAGTRLGRRVTVHAGAVIGSDGFGYVYRDGNHDKIPHVGRCLVGDDVEIGANTTIDRGSIDDTVIGAGTKIDNLVMIAHNCRIGRLCLIMSQVGLAGSVRLEDGVILAGQAGIQGHATIGAGAKIGGQAGVFGDVPAGEAWSGYPARPHREALRAQAAVHRLAGMLRELERLLGRLRGNE